MTNGDWNHIYILYIYTAPIKECKTVKSEPKTDSDQAEGCRNNLSFWRGWKGNEKYLITLWKAKISVPPYLPLSTGLTDPQSEQILTYIYIWLHQ